MPNWKNQYFRYKEVFLNISNLYKKNRDLKMFLELFLSLAAVGFFSVFALKPTVITIIELNKEIKSKEETIAKMDTKIKNLSLAQSVYSQEQENIKILNQAIPEGSSVDVFTKQIEGLSVNDTSNLINLSVGRSPLIGQDTTKLSDEEKTLLPAGITGVTFSLNFNSNFSSLSALLNHLENMRRPMVVNGFTLAIPTKESVGDNLNFTISGLLPFLENTEKTANAEK